MSSKQSSFDYFSVEVKEPKTPPPSSSPADTQELTRSARRIHLTNDMRRNISRTKSGFVSRKNTTSSRVDELETELSALRGKVPSMESLLMKYRNALDESDEKVDLMSKGILAVIENFEVGLKSSGAGNRTASCEMSTALKEAALKVLTRHEKGLSENSQMFEAAISSLRELTDTEDYSSNLLEQ